MLNKIARAIHRRLVRFDEALVAVLFSLPILFAMQGGAIDAWTLAGVAVWLIAVAGETIADRQLAAWRSDPGNAGRTCRAGLWRYSRHPNYFGEQLFWWSIAGFGIACGQPWVVVGTALNSCVLAAVTVMTERKIAEVPERSALFADYRSRTSAWIPWPPARSSLPNED